MLKSEKKYVHSHNDNDIFYDISERGMKECQQSHNYYSQHFFHNFI